MKCVILAGGRGTRIGEETHLRPKPMIEIGGRPILWHIMKIYSAHGVNDFIICLGYRGYMIKEYFHNYFLHNADSTIDLATNQVTYLESKAEPWRVTLIDTGGTTMTGGRLKRIAHHLASDESFCFTYGDGLADIDLSAEIAFHRDHGRRATMAVVTPPARFGSVILDKDAVASFDEKPVSGAGQINGGFFVLEPSVIDLIEADSTVWEGRPLERLAAAEDLRAWTHPGFWQPMDTLRERDELEKLWNSGSAPWKVW